ncbi:MAG: PAS domain S-box protein [candidate division Zixibacteria bacterium]|nr:PAS domain S-box protein [candidate division Zixibacteria bacterium]
MNLEHNQLVDGKYSFQDLVDIDRLREIFDHFSLATGFITGLVSYPEEKPLIVSGWRDICTKFHREFPTSLDRCRQSYRKLMIDLKGNKRLVLRQCENGLVDAVMPIIIEDVHIANMITGQILFEKPDINRFRKQGAEYGYNLDAYLKALEKVPVVKEETLEKALAFLGEMVVLLAEQGLNEFRSRELAQTAKVSEEKLQLLIGNMGDMVSRHLADGTITYISPSCDNLLGYRPEELLNLLSAEFIHPQDVDETMAIINNGVSRQDDYYRLQYRLRHKEGKYIWVETLGRLVYESDGSLHEIQCNTRDITERKRAEEALRKSKETAESYLNVAAEIIVSLDAGGNITMLNESGHSILGYKNGDLIGKNWFDTCLPERSRDDVRTVFKNLVQGKVENVKTYENLIITKNGTEKEILWHNTLLHNEIGTICGILSSGEDITERKQAEERLRESEERFRSLFENAPLGYQSLDANGNFLEINETWCKLLGYTKEEVRGRNFAEFIHPDFREHFKGNFPKFKSLGYILGVEFEMIKKDGSEIIVAFDGKIGYEKSGSFKQTHCVLNDITERKLAEEALRESEEKFSKAFHSNPAISGISDVETGEYVEVNQAFCDKLGFTPEEAIGKKANTLLHLDSKWRDHVFRKFKEQGFIRNEETVIYNKSGMPLNVLLSADIIELAGKKYNLTTAIDITDRKLADEALRSSEERFRKYISAAPDGIFVTDGQGRYVDANEAASKMTGYSKSELLNMSIPELADPKTPPGDFKRVFEELSKTGRVSTEVKFKCKDGSIIWSSLDAVTLSEDRFMAFCSDITETRRLQALESRAERLETAGIIAGQVAHDFNNLLAPLMAYPEFIHDELPHDNKAHAYLDDMESATRKMANINQDLLTMGRRGHYNQKVISLNRVVLHAAKEMESRIETVAVEMNLGDNLMNIMGGEAQIHRMLTNLLVNAQDAMQDIGQITVTTENYYADDTSIAFGRVPKGEYVKLTVSDNGCGIPDDIMPKILDPFFSTKTADKKRGSGLGLSVVDAVMKDHDGHLDMSSKVGQGTSFYLYFPTTRETVGESASASIIGGTEKVLVVDDDEIQREVSSRLLTKLGYKVNSVESGEKAVEFLHENNQDIVILDMVMPGGMDGSETYRRILEIFPHQKAIILSGFSTSDRVLEAQKLGAGAFVKKPVTVKTIAVAVRTELDR